MKPNDQRRFVHKRTIGAIGGFLTGGAPGAILGFAGGGGGGRGGGRNLGLTDFRRREITQAMRAATARGDAREAAAFLRELGSQGALGPMQQLPPQPQFTGSDPGQGLGEPRSPTMSFAPTQEKRCFWPRKVDPITGECKTFLGQQPGPEPNGFGGGQTVEGGFNMPAFTPDVVGNISRMDGSTGPILRCPRGTVLATDNLCYAKGTKGLASFRKWKPTPPGFLPRSDVKCLRRAVAIKKNKSNRALFRQLGLG